MQAQAVNRPPRPLWPRSSEDGQRPSPVAMRQGGAASVLQVSLSRNGDLVHEDVHRSGGQILDSGLHGAPTSVGEGLVLVLAPDRRRARLAAEVRHALRPLHRDRCVAVSCADALLLDELRACVPRLRLLASIPEGADLERTLRHLVPQEVCGVHLTLEQAVACTDSRAPSRFYRRHDLTLAVEASGATDVARARGLGADLVLVTADLDNQPAPASR